MKTMILLNGDMVITIPKEEKQQQLAHLDRLVPKDETEFDEVTVLFDIVNKQKPLVCIHSEKDVYKPTLKLVKG